MGPIEIRGLEGVRVEVSERQVTGDWNEAVGA